MANDSLFLPAGSLRHQITILSVATLQDVSGQPTSTWTAVLTTRAAMRELSARELDQNQLITSQAIHEIKMRWTPVTLASGMRVTYGTHTYEIQDVNDVEERHRVFLLQCLEIDGSK